MGAANWQGEAALKPGLGLFRGQSGDNGYHRHWAHQLSLALDGEVIFEIDDTQYKGTAFLIPAGVKHRQLEAKVLSLYVDPTSSFLDALSLYLSDSKEVLTLSESDINRMASLLVADCPLNECLERLWEIWRIDSLWPQADPKLNLVLSELEKAVQDNAKIDREQLARICHLSPSRFSHWFRQKTGMPLKSYRKWLRLIKALEIAVLTGSLNQAAYDSGFSDQSHFTRAVTEAFGINPTNILALLD